MSVTALDHAVRTGVNGSQMFNRARFFMGRRTQCRARRQAFQSARRREKMTISTERILTTHVGSLPRSDEVVAAIAYKRLRALAEGAALATDELWRSGR
jgi:hypothetical protein